MAMHAPPEDYMAFWEWIELNFVKYYSPGLYRFVTQTFSCYTIDDLRKTLTSCHPAKLINHLGTSQYDMWRTRLIDLRIIIKFTAKSFWETMAASPPDVPFSSWYRYRASVYEATTYAFPKSTDIRGTGSPAPLYTKVSPVVAQERASQRREYRHSRRPSHSYHSYHTVPPNFPTTDSSPPVANSVHSVSSHSSRHAGGGNHFTESHLKGSKAEEYFDDGRSYKTADTVNSRLFRGDDSKESRRLRSRLEPWDKPEKARNKFTDKTTWNGTRATFREYRKMIEGHLLQVNAGYLIDPEFLAEYEVQKATGEHMTFLTSETFWYKYNVPFLQAKSDKQYLYGILVSSTRQTDNKVILENKKDLDGIQAWSQMIRDYDYGGSIELRVSDIEDSVHIPYSANYPGGLTAYVERYQALMAEMDTIAPTEYADEKKQRLLIKNVRRTPGVAHLAQHCKDRSLSYSMTANYLAQNAVIHDHDIAMHAPKRIMMAANEQNRHECLTISEVSALFTATARESSMFQAYQSFNNRTIRQNLRIPDDIWNALEPLLKEQINAIRIRVKGERDAKTAKSGSSSGPSDGKIPAQYPTMKANMVEQDKEAMIKHVAAMTALCETFDTGMELDDDDDTDDDEIVSHMFTACTTVQIDKHSIHATPLTVHAHFEYTASTTKNYAISDSGADSCCLGKHCHPVSYTGRYAVLVGYNPDQTRSGKVPIITAYLKVMSQVNIPIVLRVHEAPYMKDSNVTLISEYQAREHGIVIDSVSKRHKTVNGTFGTQRMILSEHIHLPFGDRGGLMGFEILPWEEGDDEIYDIFDITRDTPWTPRKFRDDDNFDVNAPNPVPEITVAAAASLHNPDTEEKQITEVYGYVLPIVITEEPEPYYFDPDDAKLVTLGHAAQLAIAKEFPQDTPADDLLAYLSYRELTGYDTYDGYYDGYPDVERQSFHMNNDIPVPSVFDTKETPFDTCSYAVASWHRVLHDNLHPKQLQPYLGWAPVRVIQKTLEVTTQLAKMVIRYPLRRHIRSRLSFMRAQRLNEVVSTDPMFANCKCFGLGWTGGQVFYGLKSTKMDIIGFKGKGEFPRCYRDYIRTNGVPSGLRRDNAKEEQSAEVDEIHRELYIKDEFSEPYNQQQNPVESRAIRYIKEHVHVLLDRTGAPDAAWFHAAKYLCEIHSILSNKHLPNGMTPQQFRTGVTTDISPWLQFQFYQPILYLDNENSWPSSKERSGYWLGISENIGDFLTYWILDDQSKQVLARSVVRPNNRNRRVKWDPVTASRPVRETAHHGGDIKPATSEIREKMSNLEDSFDEQEPDPEPHFFDPETVQTEKEKTISPIILDTSLEPFVPVTQDQYTGPNRLRFSRDLIPMDPEIVSFPRSGKEPYSDIRYEQTYAPEEQPYEVEIVPKEPHVRNEQEPDLESPNGTEENQRRTSGRTRKEPVRFTGNMQTVWRPGKVLKSWAKAATLGIMLLPTVVLAEPTMGMHLGAAILFPDPTALAPLDTTTKMEQLRAYHARLEVINDAFSGDPEQADWKPEFVERYIYRDKGNNGSKEIVFKVQWIGGERSWVRMDDLRTHDPFLVIRYGLRHKLTEKQGWEWVNPYLNSDTEISNMIRAYKVSTEIAYKFGVQVPRNTKDSLRLDTENANTLWSDAIKTEFKQINDYETFRVLENHEPMPTGYKRIPYHCIYDVKFDGRRKCRLVAGGHRTDPPKEDIYSGVVSMEAVRLGFILARMNGLQVCAGDVGNAFLYGKTREKVFVIAGEEFGIHAGKRMIIDRSLYGLKSSSARFHEHLSVRLRQMGYLPSKADPDLWYKKVEDHYEYVARFVDDVISFSKNPMAIMKDLEKHYIMKGVGKPQYYLGGDVVELGEEWIAEGIYTAFSAETYIKNSLGKLATMCGKPHFPDKKTPFSDTYHPELDETELLRPADISKFKSLIGSGNWLITLGRFDIQYAISTMSQYSMAPRRGHMEELQRVFGYLQKYSNGKIPIDIADPPIRKETVYTSGQQWIEFYPDASEDIPDDMLEPKGMEARLTVYVDADHARNKVTRRSVTGIIMLLNNTPLVWISKRQKTVETSTYGSELVAARIAIDLIIEMRYKLRLLGVRLEEQTVMLGDNMSVVLNTTIPSSSLKKKHLACSYHRIREAIAGRYVKFGHVRSEKNLADVNTKPLDSTAFHRIIDPYLFRNPEHLRVAKGEAVIEGE
jgi:hypothetical protein